MAATAGENVQGELDPATCLERSTGVAQGCEACRGGGSERLRHEAPFHRSWKLGGCARADQTGRLVVKPALPLLPHGRKTPLATSLLSLSGRQLRESEEMAEKLTEPLRIERRRWPRYPVSEEGPPVASPAALKPLAFSTRGLAPVDQFRAWQSYMSAVFDVSLPQGVVTSDGFAADHVAWNLGHMLFVRQNTPAHGFERTGAMMRSSSIDHWQVATMRSGQSWTEVDGRVAANRPGKVQFGCLGNPFRGRATSSESLILYLPRDLFAPSSTSIDAMNNTVLSGNAAMLLIAYLDAVEARLPCLTKCDLPRVVNGTRDMIIDCSDASREGDASADATANLAFMERARRYVRLNLGAEDLSPDHMARGLGVSRTRLYQLFETSGGVLHYIQRRRLQAAHVALADPADTRRIIDIAEAVGFSSAANFSRSFSKEFGYSPREARNAVVLNRRLRPVAGAVAEEDLSFHGWLKILGS